MNPCLPHRAPWLGILGGLLLATPSPASGATAPRLHALYGDDDRREAYEVVDRRVQDWAAAVCLLVADEALETDAASGSITLRTRPYRVAGLVPCPEERFADQPTAGFCTGFLVASNLVATAGHCLDGEPDLARVRFVFGFRMTDPTHAETTFERRRVVRGVELVARVETETRDFAVVRLETAVDPDVAFPLEIQQEGPFAGGSPVGILGHPAGLPLKLAFGEPTRASVDPSHPSLLIANLDAYGGNSGSPVFDLAGGRVAGILVRGRADYARRTGPCFGSITYPDNILGESATRTTEIPWARVLDTSPAPNDAFERRESATGDAGAWDAWNIHATAEPGEPPHGANRGGKSLWWRWRPDRDGVAVLSTAGSDIDTQLALYRGGTLAGLERLAWAENGSAVGPSFLATPVQANQEYAIAVDGREGRAGRIHLAVALSTDAGARFANPTPLPTPMIGRASLYPSPIRVEGLTGVVSRVRVTLPGITYPDPEPAIGQLRVLLVGPRGQRVLLLSRVADRTPANDLRLELDDAATESLPESNSPPLRSGRYRPTVLDGGAHEAFPSPAPPPPYGTRLADLAGADPNGDWSLFVWDAFSGFGTPGQVGGWELTLETTANSPPALAPLEDLVLNPAEPPLWVPLRLGDAETPAAQLRVVASSEHPEIVADDGLAVFGSGSRRRLAISPRAGRTGEAVLAISVTDGVGASFRRSFRVQIVGEGPELFANPAPVTLPDRRGALPNPSGIPITNRPGVLRSLHVGLVGFRHAGPEPAPNQVRALLVGPRGGKVLLMSNAGGRHPVEDADLVFDDHAPALPGSAGPAIASGWYRPTALGNLAGALTSPAPGPPYGDSLAAFLGTDPNGTWRLYLDDCCTGYGSSGTLEGWFLRAEIGDPDIAPPPRILEFRRDPGTPTLRIRWDARAGDRYRLQARDGLATGEWADADEPLTASGSVAEARISLGSELGRFYRVVRLP